MVPIVLISYDDAEPLYRQTYRAVRAAILAGRLRPGDRLPSTRRLSAENGISRNVVLLAYDQLIAEGYAEARVGSGTYVAPTLPDALLTAEIPPHLRAREAPRAVAGPEPSALSPFGRYVRAHVDLRTRESAPPRYDFRYWLPAPDDVTRRAWRAAIARHARAPSIDYGHPAGHPGLREAIARLVVTRRGVTCDPDQIVIVSGTQEALDLVARILLGPRDRVVLEEPGYHGARQAFEAAGATVVPVAVDDEGLDVDSAGRAAARAKLAYVTPSHQFPTGAVMPLARRLQLLEWARANGACVVEDDYDSEFRYEGRPIEAIHGLDSEGTTIYVGTFSKVLFPAIRLGFLVLPPSLAPVFAGAKWITNRHTPTLPQLALTELIVDGHFERHLRRMRTLYATRRAALVAALRSEVGAGAVVAGTNAGIHLTVWLPGVPFARTGDLCKAARRWDVGLYGVSAFYQSPPEHVGLLFGTGALDVREMNEGIRRFAEALAEIRTVSERPSRQSSP